MSLGRITKELTTLGHFLEAGAFVVGHVLLDEAASVRNLALLRDVGVIHGASEGVLIGLDQAADSGDVEGVGFSATSEVIGEGDLLTRAL